MMRPTWQEVVELSPRQARTRRVLVAWICVFVFLTVLAGVGLIVGNA